MNKVRVRFAPSPTGFMHIGNFRSALYDYLFARKHSGDFVLRIEDTDQKRFVSGALESLVKVLDWAGIKYNEGVMLRSNVSSKVNTHESKNYPGIAEIGEYGPYIQSEKLEIYKKYAEKLVAKGHAYYCFCQPERLDEMRKEQSALKKPPIYDRYCLKNISKEEINKNLKNNCPYTIRLKMPENEIIELEDIVRGKVKFNTDLVDDTVLIKSDGYPTYHLANTVDDHEMGITHVIRGEEWLSSVPKHLLIYRYLGWEPPHFAHVPLLLNPDRSKLSKRQGDVAVEDYIQKGYLPEALLNFVAFLGWNPGQGSTKEIYSLEELIQEFSLEKIHKGGAVFDLQKLDWINSQWIKKIDFNDLLERALLYYEKFIKTWSVEHGAWSKKNKKEEYIKKVLMIERDRLSKLSEVGESNKFFFVNIDYDKELLRWKDMDDDMIKKSLGKSEKIFEEVEDENWTKENLEKLLIEAATDKKGELLWPLRAALTGEKKSPSPFEVAWVLGKEETLRRLQNAIRKIS